MNTKRTIVSIVIVAVLGGALYFLYRVPEKPSKDSIPKENLFSFKPDDIQEFTLTVGTQPPATIRRAAAAAPSTGTPSKPDEKKDATPQWQVAAPDGVAADSSQIQTFVEEIVGLQSTPLKQDTAPNWPEFGLDKPDHSYQFKLKDGKTVSLDIGQQNPGGNAHYARKDNAPPLLLLDNIDDKSLIEKTLFDLRDKRILPIKVDDAKRMELHFDLSGQKASAEELAKAKQLGLPTKPALLVFTKESDGNWDLDEPRVRTDHGNTTYLFTTISGGAMRSLEEEKPASLAKYGLDHPQIRFDIVTPSGTYSLMVGNKDKKGDEEFFYAKNSVWPHVFTIPRTVYDQLNQDKDAYRNRYLYDFDEGNAHSLDIQGPDGSLRVAQRGGDWYAAAGPQTQNKEIKLDSAKMQNFLSAIHALRISNYTSDEPGRFAAYGLDKPWMTTKVTFGDKNQTETIVFSRKDKKFYAGRVGEPSVYELSPNEPDNLQSKVKELTAPSAPAAPPEGAASGVMPPPPDAGSKSSPTLK